ncbi:TPA: hypothetical protein G8S59_004017 [Salmonella enterica]|uniref:Flagellar protein n=1 Tax=Salmonella enterica TaxID=28901 RepID=A0A756YGJ2_SALER|nr:hypothetical protein [Salmonella enterica subsp. enterica serovar Richmond]HAG0390721.1 hypothetical protein [Salmonella enterica]
MAASNITGTGVDVYPLWMNAGMLLVIALIIVLCYIGKTRLSNTSFKKSVLFQVKQTQTLKSGAQLVVVEIDEQQLLLGVTSGSIVCLKIIDKKTEATSANFMENKTRGDFKKMVLNIMKDRHSWNKNE